MVFYRNLSQSNQSFNLILCTCSHLPGFQKMWSFEMDISDRIYTSHDKHWLFRHCAFCPQQYLCSFIHRYEYVTASRVPRNQENLLDLFRLHCLRVGDWMQVQWSADHTGTSGLHDNSFQERRLKGDIRQGHN